MGRTVPLDGQTFTVIGVMPPGFRFPLDEEPADVWASAGNLYRFDRQWRGYKAYRSVGRLARAWSWGGRGPRSGSSPGGCRSCTRRRAPDGPSPWRPTTARCARAGRPSCRAGGGGGGVAGRLRERRQPAAGAGQRPPPGAGHPRGPGGGPRADHPAVPDREPVAGVDRRGTGAGWRGRGVDLLVALLPDDVPRVYGVRFDGRVLLYTLAAALGTALVVGWYRRCRRADATCWTR